MPSVLNEIRRLERARDRGEIDGAKVAELRRKMLAKVEEAQVEHGPAPAKAPMTKGQVLARDAVWTGIALVIFTAFVAWLIADIALAAMLGVVLFAGWVVHAAQKITAEDKADAARRAPKPAKAKPRKAETAVTPAE